MEIFLVYTCDVWKGSDSFRLRGIFTEREKVRLCVQALIRNKVIDYEPESCGSIDNNWGNFTLKMITDKIPEIYIHVGFDGECELDGGFVV
jgi:hypothetical protein